MKRAFSAVLSVVIVSAFASCESTNSRRAGGGAFDESELGRKLDANSHLDDPEIPGERSYEQWRNEE
jgi:hypothetical protein